MIAQRHDLIWKWGLRGAFFGLLILAWEWFGQVHGGLLFAPFSATLQAFVALVADAELYQALWISNQALLIGFGAALLIGIPLGLLIGRVPIVERLTDNYLNILIVTPMSAMLPLIVMAIGIGLPARALVVFLFALPIIIINTRTGLRDLNPQLVEMGSAFGASETQLWRKILIPGAAPAILAGLRLGLGRALSGMVVVELLLIAVGLGRLLLGAISLFEPERAYAVILVLLIEVILLMQIVRSLESRVHRLPA